MFLICCLLLCPLFGHAATATVGCAGAVGTFDYPTLSSALSNLYNLSHRNHHITVSGTCTELVTIADFENLVVEGTPGAALVHPGTSPQPLLLLHSSKNVTVRDLLLRGSGAGNEDVAHLANALASFERCTFQDGGTGLFMFRDATVSLGNVVIRNNERAMRVSAGSVVSIGDFDPAQQSLVESNGAGIQADESAQLFLYGNVDVRNNGAFGVSLIGARVRLCCDVGVRRIEGNRIGIVSSGGYVDLIGPAEINGNALTGMQLIDSSLRLTGGQNIGQNGAGPRLRGGILARGNSHLEITGANIQGNNGSGIVLRDNSSALISSSTVSANTAGGVTVTIMSTAGMFDNNISGNGNADLSCSPDSFAYGERNGIGKLFCSRFNVEPVEGP
jgi:hypothetical protein